MTTLIEIRALSKRFGSIQAVDGVSLSVARGEVLGFLGPNGAGKSTTMKMVAGFLTPDAGTAVVCGHDVTAAPLAAKAALGYLPEGAPAYGDMTPTGFLRFCAAARGLSGKAAAMAVERAATRADLGQVLRQPIDTLSKGFKRRVGLAQALLHDPPALVMDEPTDGLDPNQKFEVRKLIAEMAPDKAIIVSTHILEEVDAVCSRAVIIAAGRVVADGAPAELSARDPEHGAVWVGLPEEAVSAAAERFASIPGVVVAARTDHGLSLRGEPGLAAVIAAIVHAEQWPATMIQSQRGRLESVFRDLTAAARRENEGEGR